MWKPTNNVTFKMYHLESEEVKALIARGQHKDDIAGMYNQGPSNVEPEWANIEFTKVRMYSGDDVVFDAWHMFYKTDKRNKITEQMEDIGVEVTRR